MKLPACAEIEDNMLLRVVCLLVCVAATQSQKGGRLGQVERIIRSGGIEGYSLASVHAMVPGTDQLIGQSKRDIEAHASDPSSDKSFFTLHFMNGERLRMSLTRRSIDTSGATLVEVKEDGEREETPLEAGNCFFSGPLVDEDGYASLDLCDGELTGSITTAQSYYEVYEIPEITSKRSTDDVMHVLVTWRSAEKAPANMESGLEAMKRRIGEKIKEREAEEDDGLEVPEHGNGEKEGNITRRAKSKKVTIEVADFVDSHHVSDMANKLGIRNTKKIKRNFINKWNQIARVFADRKSTGWDIRVRLVRLEIWRKNPSWYKTKPSDRMLNRMQMVCHQNRRESYDQITLHTGNPIVPNGKLGVSWIGGLCGAYKCSCVRFVGTGFFVEIHEFGHSLGLSHESQMAACRKDSDRVSGFMGGNREHFRGCYRGVIDKYFAKSKCIYN